MMSGNFTRFENALDEFRQGKENGLNDQTWTASAYSDMVGSDPSTKGKLEDFVISPALKIFRKSLSACMFQSNYLLKVIWREIQFRFHFHVFR